MPPTVKRLGRRAVKVTRADVNEAWGGQNTGRCKVTRADVNEAWGGQNTGRCKVTRADVNEAWGGQNTGRCKGILKESIGLRGLTFTLDLEERLLRAGQSDREKRHPGK